MNQNKNQKVTRSISSPPAITPPAFLKCGTSGSKHDSSFESGKESTETGRTRHTSLLLPNSPHFSELSFSLGGVDAYEEQVMTPYPSNSPNTPTLSPKGDKMTTESVPSSKLSKRESYKAQRKNYRREKKRVAKELLCTLKDPSIIVLADWLKVRGTLKGWTKLWCVLKPGLLLLYKSQKTQKSSQWVGTVLLNACELIERPSKKDGFCFKLFHPLEQSVWASKGPQGEAIGALVQPLPVAYLIFRASSESAGKCWMDALELALRCSSLLLRTMSSHEEKKSPSVHFDPEECITRQQQTQWNEDDLEEHFKDHDLDDDTHTDDCPDGEQDQEHTLAYSIHSTDSDSEPHIVEEELEKEPLETVYVSTEVEEFGIAGDAGQTEEVADENKSLIWSLVKQVRPGMDLSKVVLPTFILEPRSFLDKLSDYYYHADILSKAVLEDDPFTRMKIIVQWYISGFYKKPKGLKKPYNPILGEMFRCYWKHNNKGRTFYIAEQVSHHPPVSAFYVTNRQDGFCISGSILAKSKFYGNSLSAILDGTARLTILTRGEDYTLTMPYAHCKGILVGTLTMELGGKVDISCEKTGYHADIEFKLKPFLGGPELCNLVVGKIKLGKEVLATVEGHWDGEIFFRDKRTGEEHLLWNPTSEIRASRLKRYTVPVEFQDDYESENLWKHVSAAVHNVDHKAATEEKTILEEAQRKATKERQAKMEKWVPRHFVQDIITGEWIYKHADSRPWDPRTDVVQYEHGYKIQTKTRHKAPAVRTGSIISIDETTKGEVLRHISSDRLLPIPVNCLIQKGLHRGTVEAHDSESSSPDAEIMHGSDSTESERSSKKGSGIPAAALQQLLDPLEKLQSDTNTTLQIVQRHLESVMAQQRRIQEQLAQRSDLSILAAVILVQLLLHWIL